MSTSTRDPERDARLQRAVATAVAEKPLQTAFMAALGAFAGLAVFRALQISGSALLLIGLAFFLAVGLDPAVRFLGRHGLRRGWATALVLLVLFLALAGFLALAVPALVTEGQRFSTRLPEYRQQITNHQGTLGHLDQRYHLLDNARKVLNSRVANGGTLLHAGTVALGAFGAALVTFVLTVYFLADLPRVTRRLVRLAPRTRRPRVGLLAEAIFARVGAFVLGNMLTSLIAGAGTFVWLEIFRVPFATLLAVFVALIDLVPVVGSTIGGAVVTLVSLTRSLPIAIATLVFYVVYRQLEDYLINPRIIGRTVKVPPVVTIVSVLLGAALGGVFGALLAIPTAAAIRIILEEVAYPHLDEA